METKQKVWFVTGASKGFGLALVKLLLSKGIRVAATSREEKELARQVGDPNENFLPLKVDISSDESVKEALRKTVDEFGRVDVVVNNAGYAIFGSVEELTDQEFRQSMDVNVFGTINTIRNVMPYLRKQGSGHIINIASVAGYRGFPSSSAYCSAKFALIGLSESLAEEVKPLGINVTVVAPGYFRTSFLDSGSVMITKNLISAYNTGSMEVAMQQMNGRQPGDPQKLVKLLVDITSEANPPVHLVLGPDAFQLVEDTRKAEAIELETWKNLSFSTNIEG
ncbi:MAG: SDR family oxidoreductase [Chitinophagaceae bacterium]